MGSSAGLTFLAFPTAHQSCSSIMLEVNLSDISLLKLIN